MSLSGLIAGFGFKSELEKAIGIEAFFHRSSVDLAASTVGGASAIVVIAKNNNAIKTDKIFAL